MTLMSFPDTAYTNSLYKYIRKLYQQVNAFSSIS